MVLAWQITVFFISMSLTDKTWSGRSLPPYFCAAVIANASHVRYHHTELCYNKSEMALTRLPGRSLSNQWAGAHLHVQLGHTRINYGHGHGAGHRCHEDTR